MEQYCEELKRLYKEIPTYGYGSIAELNSMYLDARRIILSIAAMEEHKAVAQSLGISSVEIDNAISYARSAKSKKSEEQFFNKAAEQLGEDIKTALGLINCQ